MSHLDLFSHLNSQSVRSPRRLRSLQRLCDQPVRYALILILGVITTGCGGQKLTPKEEARYQELTQELNTLQRDRSRLERKVEVAFKKNGDLERSKRLQGAQTISCGYRLGKQSFGPLPFKKRKGKVARFDQGKAGSKWASSCKSHTLTVR